MDYKSFITTVTTLEELPKAAADLLNTFPKERIFLFYAEMGVGKTTFIKNICQQLGVSENMSSPTYPIVNEYKGTHNTIYHFDLYRLKNSHECLDIGFEEYLHSGYYCFIEWPEIAKELIPTAHVEVRMKTINDARIITAEKNVV